MGDLLLFFPRFYFAISSYLNLESGKVIKIMESVVMWANGFLAAVTVSEQPAEPQVTCVWVARVS